MAVYLGLLLVMTLLGSVASLFLKNASGSGGFAGMLKNRNLYIGGLLYIASAVLNILRQSRVRQSFSAPEASVYESIRH